MDYITSTHHPIPTIYVMTNLKRVFSFAITDFYRIKGISLASIFVLTVTTFLITGLFLIQGVSRSLITTIENKIDITAYFKQDASEGDISDVKEQVESISPDVKKVEYVSKEDALEEFIKKHKDDDIFSRALTEVGENPFLPSLNITTTGNLSLYEQISYVLESDRFKNIIEKIDFSQKKDTIEKIFSITSKVNKSGLVLSAILALVAVLVVFNTMKLVIDSSKEEISNMRIVGASSWFVRAPFVIEGAIFGFISFIACFFVSMVSVYFLSPGLESIMPGFNLFGYFVLNFWLIVLIQLASGVGLGAIFSFIAVRKYLKI